MTESRKKTPWGTLRIVKKLQVRHEIDHMAKFVTRHFRKIEVDADGRIDADLPCAECDHSLRTLREEGHCPECGFMVRRSIFIAMNPPTWHWGWDALNIVLLTLILLILLFVTWIF